jgi:hypothetical protein
MSSTIIKGASIIKNVINSEIQLMKQSYELNHALRFKEWFIANATLYKNIDKNLSNILCLTKNAKIKSCYANTLRTWNHSCKYFEGYIVCFGIPIEHAWLIKDEQVIDVTLAINGSNLIKQMKKYKMEIEEGERFSIEYYGVEIPIDFIQTNTLKRKYYGNNLFDYYLNQSEEK